MSDMFDDIEIEPDPIVEQLDALFEWVEEDYGPCVLSSVTRDLMKMTRDNPEMSFEDVIYNVSLDWSK